jgi:hypothetical protein
MYVCVYVCVCSYHDCVELAQAEQDPFSVCMYVCMY